MNLIAQLKKGLVLKIKINKIYKFFGIIKYMKKIILAISICTILLPLQLGAEEIRQIIFPIQGVYTTFSDDYGDPRSGGRVHEGVDIMAKKMTPLVSAVDGRVTSLPQEEPSWGYTIYIQDSDGYSYRYYHINNDTPGTDDGLGGTVYAFAPTITRGSPVQAGQLIGWVGDSGNAENVGSHLHFEIHLPNGDPINPYESLLAAAHPGSFNPETARLSAQTINEDKSLVGTTGATCTSNTLIKGSSTAVYYCGANGKRYVFPNQKIYTSWYADFKNVITITDEQLARINLGGNVTYRPGVRMVKVQTDPRIYVVDKGGVLRYVTTPEIGQSMYGSKWSTYIDDLSEAFFVNYTVGEPITALLTS
jgi:hypothetical protein